MFNIEQQVRNIIWNTFFLRWKEYFINKKIKNLDIYDNGEYINIDADIQWTHIYNTTIGIKPNKEILFFCDCPAYDDVGVCKHLWALAMEVSSKYNISDDLEFIDKKTKKVLNLKNNTWEKDNLDDDDDFPFWNFLMDEKFFEKIKWNKELLKKLWISNEKIITHNTNIPQKSENKLTIFSKITNKVFLSDKENENLYKIKLNFFEKWWWIQDITLNLYKSKLQKNGQLSSGALIKREQMWNISQKYKWLWSFLESHNWWYYYWNNVDDRMTFNSSPKIFISSLLNFDEVFDINNQVLNIHKEIYQLKINIENTKNDYHIKLDLVWENSSYTLAWYRLFWDTWSNYFACLTGDKHLMFFYSELNYYFIKDFNLKKEIILQRDEFESLKKQDYFGDMIEHTLNIENLAIEYIEIEPKLLLKIEIPNDYSFVKIEHIIIYNDFEINFKNVNKEIFKISSWYIKRDFDNELLELQKWQNLMWTYDEFYLNIWKKYINENIDTLFEEVEKLIQEWVKVEYKQQTKKISTWELKINLQVNTHIDFFDIESQIMLGDKELQDAKEILVQAKKWAKYITLDNWNVVIFKNDILKEVKTLDALWISEKNIWKSVQVWKYNIWLLRDEVKQKWSLFFSFDKEAKSLKEKFKNFKKVEHIEIAIWSRIHLRDYQKIWVDFIHFLTSYNFSWILADDMWLGKTIQTIAYLEKMYWENKNLWTTLIICPTSLVFNWLDEANKFTPKLKVEYIKNWKTAFSEINKKTQIIICSYWVIANLIDEWKVKNTFEYIILDEAQNIKNPVTQRTKAICALKSKNRLALSWTPIENNLIELWSIFNFLMPWFLETLHNFKSHYLGGDKDTLELLSRKVKPFILRRTKEEVLKDLPPKVEEYIKLEMWEKQKNFYNKLKNTFKAQITKKIDEKWLNKARFEVLDALLKLRQACLVPELVNLEWANFKDSIKLDYIDENIEDMIWKWHNLLIFSQFTWFLSYIKELFNKKWIQYNYLDGQTSKENRKNLVDSFNLGEVNVFIISLKAWWTWLNLTSADYVIHLDPWWNPAVENQATDRAHRIGQQKTVFVQKLIVKGSIEEKILQLQDTKKKLIDDIFSWDFSWSLDKSDIDFILS